MNASTGKLVSGLRARAGIGHWMTFCNHRRLLIVRTKQLPAAIYVNSIATNQQAQVVAEIERKLVRGLRVVQIGTIAAPQGVLTVDADSPAGISQPMVRGMLQRLKDRAPTRGLTSYRRFKLWTIVDCPARMHRWQAF